MDGFETGEIGVGVVTGIRRWMIKSDGVLRAISWSYAWTQGENVATHRGAPEPQFWYDTPCVEMSCGRCGFYGYFNDEAQYGAGSGGVVGVIEGYGHVIIGTRGFRAQRARIVALAPSDETVNPDDLIARVAAQYPEVPIYRTRVEMLAAHPTDQVEMPPPTEWETLGGTFAASAQGIRDAMDAMAKALDSLGLMTTYVADESITLTGTMPGPINAGFTWRPSQLNADPDPSDPTLRLIAERKRRSAWPSARKLGRGK